MPKAFYVAGFLLTRLVFLPADRQALLRRWAPSLEPVALGLPSNPANKETNQNNNLEREAARITHFVLAGPAT